MILKETFNLEVPIRLPQMKLPRLESNTTKYCMYHCDIGHNIEDCWTLKDKIEELIQVGYLAQFVNRSNNHQTWSRPEGHPKKQNRNQEANRRKAEDLSRPRQQQHERQPPPEHEPARHIRGVINTIDDDFPYGGQSRESWKWHLHTIQDIEVNFIDSPLQRSLPLITFTNRDFKGSNPVNQVVVSIIIANFMVSRVLIDQGCFADILYWKTF